MVYMQRLSKSVSMVSKGVLGDHLILLANSMTCTGNMIGFNSSGYKALSRALSIQVPFTEATLFVSPSHSLNTKLSSYFPFLINF